MKLQKLPKNTNGKFDYEFVVETLQKSFPVYYLKKKYICEEGQMDLREIIDLNAFDIPNNLVVDFVWEQKVAGIFSLSSIHKSNKAIKCEYYISADDLVGNKSFKWSPFTYYEALKNEVAILDEVSIEKSEMSPGKIFNSANWIKITSPLFNKVSDCIAYANKKIEQIHSHVQISLGNISWNKAYEKNEGKFCVEILEPLFRKMKFNSVNYSHGKREFGKDFTFFDIDKFGQIKYHGVQVKAGNISGKVNSQIDEIIGQIQDAFRMPYYDINSKSPCYISTFLIVISGNYTENAKEKILHKVDKGLHGSVYFIDQQHVLELIEKFWTK